MSRFPWPKASAQNSARCSCGIHREHGIHIEPGVLVREVLHDGTGRATGVQLADDRTVPADVVLVGIGARPAVDWLRGSGVPLGNGVLCDATLHAGDGVWAAGDVACWPHPMTGELTRIEHRTNASEAGLAVARNILAGPQGATDFAPVPYVWSDQYNLKIQIYGSTRGADRVRIVEGSTAERKLVALYGKAGRVCGVVGVNMVRAVRKWRAAVVAAEPFDTVGTAAGRGHRRGEHVMTPKSTPRAGVVGLGMIGGGVAVSLTRSGQTPAVFDVRPDAADQLPGVPDVLASPAEVAAASDVMMIAVVNAAQARQAITGEDGILSAARPGSTVVLLSTVALPVVRELATACAEREVGFLDCGVTPGDKAAEHGMVAIVGGNAEVVESARPVLAGWAKRIVHCGPSGAGMATKIARNVVTYGTWRTVHEAAALASAAGVDPVRLAEVIEAADPDGRTLLQLLGMRGEDGKLPDAVGRADHAADDQGSGRGTDSVGGPRSDRAGRPGQPGTRGGDT